MSNCEKCGEGLVCPKCTPVIEHTNAIIVRYKDTSYNGGYPNSLSIVPVFVNDDGRRISVAILTGDNFYEGFTFYSNRGVEETARFLSTCDVDDLMQMFNLKRPQKKPLQDLLKQIKEYVNEESTK